MAHFIITNHGFSKGSTWLPSSYLCPTYLFTYHLPTYVLLASYYLHTIYQNYLFFYLPTYLPIVYINRYAYLPIYLVRYPLTYLWKKLKFKCFYTHWQKNSWKFMLNPFGIILIKWWGGLMAKTLVWNQGSQGSIPFTNIYYVKYVWGLLLTTPCSHINEEHPSLFLNPQVKFCMWDKNNVIVSKVQWYMNSFYFLEFIYIF